MKKQVWWLGSFIILFATSIAYGQAPVVTNVTDTQFTISWVSEQIESAQVQYGQSPAELNKIAVDDRGEGIVSQTHYVTISGLKPQYSYYYQVISGSQTIKSGQITTGPSMVPVGSNIVYGRVLAGNQPAEGAIVYLTLSDGDSHGSREESAQMSVLVSKQGYWCAELVNVRTADLNNLFKYSVKGDNLLIKVKTGENGQGGLKITPLHAFPTPDIILAPEGSQYITFP